MIKTVLSLQHAELPPTLHYESPNPQADFPSSPFYVNGTLRPWDVDEGMTRIAGVTGLGRRRDERPRHRRGGTRAGSVGPAGP